MTKCIYNNKVDMIFEMIFFFQISFLVVPDWYHDLKNTDLSKNLKNLKKLEKTKN